MEPFPPQFSRFREALVLAVAALQLWVNPLPSGAQAPPDVSVAISPAALSLDSGERKMLALALTAAASNFPDAPVATPEFRRRALGLARLVDPTNPAAILAETLETKGMPLRTIDSARNDDLLPQHIASPATLSDFLWGWSGRLLTTPSAGAANASAGAYLADIAIALNPDDQVKGLALLRLAPAAANPSWEQLLAGESAGPAAGPGTPPPPARDPPPPPAAPNRPEQLPRLVASTPVLSVEALGNRIRTRVSNLETRAIKINDTSLAEGSTPQLVINGAPSGIQPIIQAALGRITTAQPELVPTGIKIDISLHYIARNASRLEITLPCAIAAYAVFPQQPLDHRITFLGNMDENFRVLPVPETMNFVRYLPLDSAIDQVVISTASAAEVADLVLSGELELLLRTPILAAQNLEEALEFARSDHPADFAKATEIFASVQQAAADTDPATLLQYASVQERLREVVELVPNHYSARYLLLAGLGRFPQSMTFPGSRAMLSSATNSVVGANVGPRPSDADKANALEVCARVVEQLKRLRPKIDPATVAYSDALQAYTQAYYDLLGTSQARLSPRANALRETMTQANERLRAAIVALVAEEIKRFGAPCQLAMPDL